LTSCAVVGHRDVQKVGSCKQRKADADHDVRIDALHQLRGTSGISTSCGNSFPRDRSTAVNMSDAQRSLRRFAISKYPLFINVHFWFPSKMANRLRTETFHFSPRERHLPMT
jgi:hypothetical protein